MTAFQILVTVLLFGLTALSIAIWRELRAMRARAGLLPPKKKPLPERKL